jgi:ubiquinone/menaquinone biosynthesis C-methylase UbiE
MFYTFNDFRRHNEGREISNHKDFYQKFSNEREFGGEFSHDDHLLKNRFMDVYSTVINIILRHKPANLIDVGCGAGMYLPLSGYFPSVDYTGLDYADQAINSVKSKYPKVVFRTGDAFSIPFENQCFDVAILSGVLILYKSRDDQEALLKEVLRVTKKDGILILIVWNDALLFRWCVKISRLLAIIRRKDTLKDFMGVHFSNKEITSLSESVGGKVEYIYNTAAHHGLIESCHYLSLRKYTRRFDASEKPNRAKLSQNYLQDLENASGWPFKFLFPICRILPSLFNMYSICVIRK